jgi:hypothetical protein
VDVSFKKHFPQISVKEVPFPFFPVPYGSSHLAEILLTQSISDVCGGVPVRYKDAVTGAVQSSRTGSYPAGDPPVPNPLFGKARTIFNPRQLQLSAKVAF